MKRIKGLLGILLAAMMFLTPIVSCAEEEITLRMSWWGSETRHEATLAIMDKYCELHPNIKMEGEYGVFNAMYQKLLTQLAGGTAPDVIFVDYQWIPALLEQGHEFVDMTTLGDLIDMTYIDMNLARSYASDGDYLLGLPVGVNGHGYMYNSGLAESLGIELHDNLSWEDLIELGKKVQEQDPSKHLMCSTLNHYVFLVKARVKQMAGNPLIKDDKTFGFTREQMVEIFSYIDELVKTKTVLPFEESSLYDNAFADQTPPWLEQRVVIYPSSSSFIPSAIHSSDEIVIDSCRYPGVEGAVNPGILVTPSMYMAVYAKSEHIEEAADFISFFLNNDEAIKIAGDTRSVPASAKAQQILLENNAVAPQTLKFLEQARSAPGLPDNSLSLNAEILAVLQEYIQQIGFGMMSPEDAADGLMDEWTDMLSKM